MKALNVREAPLLLKGEVTAQFVRCGKPVCRCRTGELHGPYYYRVWRDGEKIRKQYVRPEDVETVRAACRAYVDARRMLRENQQAREALSRSIRQNWRAIRKTISACSDEEEPAVFTASPQSRSHAAKNGGVHTGRSGASPHRVF